MTCICFRRIQTLKKTKTKLVSSVSRNQPKISKQYPKTLLSVSSMHTKVNDTFKKAFLQITFLRRQLIYGYLCVWMLNDKINVEMKLSRHLHRWRITTTESFCSFHPRKLSDLFNKYHKISRCTVKCFCHMIKKTHVYLPPPGLFKCSMHLSFVR